MVIPSLFLTPESSSIQYWAEDVKYSCKISKHDSPFLRQLPVLALASYLSRDVRLSLSFIGYLNIYGWIEFKINSKVYLLTGGLALNCSYCYFRYPCSQSFFVHVKQGGEFYAFLNLLFLQQKWKLRHLLHLIKTHHLFLFPLPTCFIVF